MLRNGPFPAAALLATIFFVEFYSPTDSVVPIRQLIDYSIFHCSLSIANFLLWVPWGNLIIVEVGWHSRRSFDNYLYFMIGLVRRLGAVGYRFSKLRPVEQLLKELRTEDGKSLLESGAVVKHSTNELKVDVQLRLDR